MPAPEIIHQLVNKFTENRDAYLSATYKEARLRQEFLDPFFRALGWDVGNHAGVAPDNAEVVIEDSIHTVDKLNAPDYAFRIENKRKFFVEAKKPSVDIQGNIHPAFQVRIYAWNAKLPLSILTDFQEFAIYDCRPKPDSTDPAATSRYKYFRYTEYIEKWDEIASLFSRTAVCNNSLEQFAIENKAKKGSIEVDDAILADIEDWRKLLALNIALRNPQVADERQLNYAVQMTIDRILFLRICEDRGIEPDEQLKALTAEANIYPRLVDLFRRADKKYNSGLFHFEKEKGSDAPADTFTPALRLDDKVLKEIIHKIYYPCPYIFKEIPVEILGQVYEQFLGKVIHLTAGHQARVEEKPEVRKAGGVYYTPQYIVDYIVANTVGKLLEGKTPEQSTQLKIVDPACGSGSFLLGAFHYLLDWHKDWYTKNDPAKWTRGKDPALIATAGGWHLTTQKKKEILVNNIHGVDIDPQAVEVTKLSLLLKVLEEESGQLSLGFERVLPDLGRNIQCGNSLIDEDYFEGQLVIDEKERQRVNPFDWHAAFPEVFIKGGFDAVIGNPPYVRQESLGTDKKYFQNHYQVFAGTADLYSYFIEKGVNLLAQNGQFSYIVGSKWMRANYGESLRKWLKTKCIESIIDFGDLAVFENATTYTCIIRISNKNPHQNPIITLPKSLSFSSLTDYVKENGSVIDQKSFKDNGWPLADSDKQDVISKISLNTKSLGLFVKDEIYRGILTGFNDAFVINEEIKDQLIAEDPKSSEIIKPFLVGKDIRRYSVDWQNRYLIFTRHGIAIKEYPSIYKHLLQYKERLTPRPKDVLNSNWSGRKPGPYKWYEIQDTIDYYREFEKSKILWPGISKQVSAFAFDDNKLYGNDNNQMIISSDRYLLGILNSQLMKFVLTSICDKVQGGFYRLKIVYVKKLPIHLIDFSNPADVKRHDQMVALVTRMLDLHKRVPATPQESEQLARDIASTDRQIDALVYDLYALTPAEIKIVETP
jgi:type I restriction-modification system DNA methylase subunit